MQYQSSKGPVAIDTMPLSYAKNALNKLRRTEPDRTAEIDALDAHVTKLTDEATEAALNPRAQIELAEEELYKVAGDGGAENATKTFAQATTMAVNKMASSRNTDTATISTTKISAPNWRASHRRSRA